MPKEICLEKCSFSLTIKEVLIYIISRDPFISINKHYEVVPLALLTCFFWTKVFKNIITGMKLPILQACKPTFGNTAQENNSKEKIFTKILIGMLYNVKNLDHMYQMH